MLNYRQFKRRKYYRVGGRGPMDDISSITTQYVSGMADERSNNKRPLQ